MNKLHRGEPKDKHVPVPSVRGETEPMVGKEAAGVPSGGLLLQPNPFLAVSSPLAGAGEAEIEVLFPTLIRG